MVGILWSHGTFKSYIVSLTNVITGSPLPLLGTTLSWQQWLESMSYASRVWGEKEKFNATIAISERIFILSMTGYTLLANSVWQPGKVMFHVCDCLDRKFSQSSCVKGVLPIQLGYWELVGLLRSEIWWEEVGSRDMPTEEGDIGTLASLSIFCASWLSWGEQLCPTTHSTDLLCHAPSSIDPKGTNPATWALFWSRESKYRVPSFKLVISNVLS